MPQPSIIVPMSRAFRHSFGPGSVAPRASCQAISTNPAHRKRVAIMKNGANPTRANRITRYVEPQISQVAARQLSTKSDSARGGAIVPLLSAAKCLFDSPFKGRFDQCDVPLPLHLDHFRLIYRDGSNFEAHDCRSIALHEAGCPGLIFICPGGHRLSVIENLGEFLA